MSSKNAPTLANVLKTAAQNVTGEKVASTDYSGQYAASRITTGLGPSVNSKTSGYLLIQTNRMQSSI